MKIGDKVRFLSEVGGGRVAGFQGKNIVLVEDEDGFQVPTPINDIVVVDNDDYSMTRFVAEKKEAKPVLSDDEDYDPADRPVTFKATPEERKGGDKLSAYIAYVPMSPKEMTTTRFETYIINDSNYYMYYTYMTAEGNNWHLRATGEIDPNTKLYLEEFGREDLNEFNRIAVQIIAYKRDKSYLLKPVVDVQLRLDPVKFYKLHTFKENDFFEQSAYILTLIENDAEARPLVVDAKRLKQEMLGKINDDCQKSHAPQYKKDDPKAPIVVDLHASELLETTAGMSPSDILNYQLDFFRKTLKQHEKDKGRKIVFIHGKGEGILRQALINELRYRFKSYTYQDASFQEYGYGATQVTIKN
ncbi:MAG: DUF2027 domain-containing protein [Prevotella sp.]